MIGESPGFAKDSASETLNNHEDMLMTSTVVAVPASSAAVATVASETRSTSTIRSVSRVLLVVGGLASLVPAKAS